jgi:predicted RNA-binding protein Jag
MPSTNGAENTSKYSTFIWSVITLLTSVVLVLGGITYNHAVLIAEHGKEIEALDYRCNAQEETTRHTFDELKIDFKEFRAEVNKKLDRLLTENR